MSPVAKITWALVIVIAAVAAVISQFVPARQRVIDQPKATASTGELVGGVLIGQTFTAHADNLSGIAVKLDVASSQGTETINLHVRSSLHDSHDIRTASVRLSQLDGNEFHRFVFDPIPDSGNSQYFFFLISPSAQPGNAAAVSISTANPYHEGTAYIVRNGENIEEGIRPATDLAFRTYHTVPLRAAIVNEMANGARAFIATWDDNQPIYAIWAKSALPALFFIFLLVFVSHFTYVLVVARVGKTQFTALVLGLLCAIGVLLRLMYARELPITHEEGQYLYEAASIQRGSFAGGDGYVKSPLVIAWMAFWQTLLGNTLFAGRLSSIVAGVLTMFPLYFLTTSLWSSRAVTHKWTSKNMMNVGWGRRVGIIAAAIWALFGAGVVFNVYAHAQPLALFFAVSALSLLLAALRGRAPRLTYFSSRKAPSANGWFVTAGVLFGLAVLSSKSTLLLIPVALLFILMEGLDWKNRGKHMSAIGSGFFAVLVIFLAGAWWVYGLEGVWEAMGVYAARDAFALRQFSPGGVIPMFREALPLLFLALIGLGMICEQTIRSFFRDAAWLSSRTLVFFLDVVVPKAGWILPWAIFLVMWLLFLTNENALSARYGLPALWYANGAILLLITALPRLKAEQLVLVEPKELVVPVSQQPGRIVTQSKDMQVHQDDQMRLSRHATAALIAPLWVGALLLFYVGWVGFHPEHVAELIPPLTILAAYGAVALYYRLKSRLFLAKDYPAWELIRRVFVISILVVLFWAAAVSNYMAFLFEHTGAFHQRAAQEAAEWADRYIPAQEPIFTGAALIPYLSGHRTSLNIARSAWYGRETTRTHLNRLNAFLPSTPELSDAFRKARWVLVEERTRASFIEPYPAIQEALEHEFIEIKTIHNGANPMTFYFRVVNHTP